MVHGIRSMASHSGDSRSAFFVANAPWGIFQLRRQRRWAIAPIDWACPSRGTSRLHDREDRARGSPDGRFGSLRTILVVASNKHQVSTGTCVDGFRALHFRSYLRSPSAALRMRCLTFGQVIDGRGLETVGIVYAAGDNRTARRGVTTASRTTTALHTNPRVVRMFLLRAGRARQRQVPPFELNRQA